MMRRRPEAPSGDQHLDERVGSHPYLPEGRWRQTALINCRMNRVKI